MLLAELIPLSNQAQYKNGSILAGGLVYVYYKGRTALATTYSDPVGDVENSNPIILDNEGRCSVFASLDYSYTLVFCDKYGQEQFSYDKELLDAVPVDDTYSIGIKGDDTISVDKSLSGQTVVFNLHAKGEDYNGIEPVVVNNQERLISANHKPLGVEEPLYFVKDDEEATIIGIDDEAITSAVSGIAAPIVSGVVSGISGQFALSSDLSAYYPASNPSGFITGVPDGYATKTWVEDQHYLTAHQNLSGLMSADKLEFREDGKISGYNGSSFAGGVDPSALEPYMPWSASGTFQPSGNYVSASDFTAYTAAHSGDDVTPYSGSNGIQIQNHIVSITGQLGKVYSGENHVVVNNTTDKIGLDASAVSAIESLQGVYDLSAGQGVSFRKEGNVVYVDAIGADIDYTPIIEDI
jgi:hypothetical protein